MLTQLNIPSREELQAITTRQVAASQQAARADKAAHAALTYTAQREERETQNTLTLICVKGGNLPPKQLHENHFTAALVRLDAKAFRPKIATAYAHK